MNVKLTQVPGWGPFRKFRAEVNPRGDDLPRKTQLNAADMLRARPGARGAYPRGVEKVRHS